MNYQFHFPCLQLFEDPQEPSRQQQQATPSQSVHNTGLLQTVQESSPQDMSHPFTTHRTGQQLAGPNVSGPQGSHQDSGIGGDGRIQPRQQRQHHQPTNNVQFNQMQQKHYHFTEDDTEQQYDRTWCNMNAKMGTLLRKIEDAEITCDFTQLSGSEDILSLIHI